MEAYEQSNTDENWKSECHVLNKDGGMLCKPCPMCGYGYGSQWLYRPIHKNTARAIYKPLSAND